MTYQEEEVVVEDQLLQFVINEKETEISTLLKIYVLVKASGVEGLEDYILDYLQESGVLDRLTAVENGETGTLEDNFNEMNFGTLDGISVVRGIWDESSKRVLC